MLLFHSLDWNIFYFIQLVSIFYNQEPHLYAPFNTVNFLPCLNDFVFNLLNFRYFSEKLSDEKRIKELNSGGMAQEERPVGREREGKKRRTAAQVHDSFNSNMQCQIKYFFKCFTLWYLFLLKWGLFVNNSSIGTQQFNNHTSRVYTVSFTSSMLKYWKSRIFLSNINLTLIYCIQI